MQALIQQVTVFVVLLGRYIPICAHSRGPDSITAPDSVLLSVGVLGLQHLIGGTTMAMILRFTAFVATISDKAVLANLTVIGYGYLYHVP